MNLYIAGPMRGYPHQNHPAFHSATRSLRALGHTVYSPAERDQAAGVDPASPATLNIRSALTEVITWVLQNADAVIALPGWDNSRGARAEIAVAWAVDMRVWELVPFLTSGIAAAQVRTYPQPAEVTA